MDKKKKGARHGWNLIQAAAIRTETLCMGLKMMINAPHQVEYAQVQKQLQDDCDLYNRTIHFTQRFL